MPDELLPQADLAQDVRPIAERYIKANGLLFRGLNMAAEWLASRRLRRLIPNPAKRLVSDVIEDGLKRVYDAAAFTHPNREPAGKEAFGAKLPEVLKLHKRQKFNQVAATIAGGLGGAGGLAATVAELPVTIGLIFREIQRVSKQYGRDPASETAKQECLAVFQTGTPLKNDDEIEFGFIGVRVATEGTVIYGLISRIAPELLKIFGPRLMSPPVVGGFTGAVFNFVYIDHFRELAHVNFQLGGLAQIHGDAKVVGEFKRQVAEISGKRAAM